MTNIADLPHVLSAKHIQEYLGVSNSKAYELFKLKGFPAIVIGGNKRVYKSDFLAWIESQKVTKC